MRIGIVADIHDAVAPLRRALSLLADQGAEQIVTLGDAFETVCEGEPGCEVAALLSEAKAIGVWGNHDVGLSHDLTDDVREIADASLLAFTARLQPHLITAGCRFSHREAWRDHCSISGLWSFDGIPDTMEKVRRSLDAVPERILFMGHFHTWQVHRQDGAVDWNLHHPVRLTSPDRFVVVVAPVLEGWCGLFDTGSAELTAIRCSA